AEEDIPIDIGLSAIVAIEGSRRGYCAIGADGELWCWGGNRSGEVGTGDLSMQPVPVRIAVPPAGRVAMQYSHTCAETRDGLYCGVGDDRGHLGRLTSDVVASPTPIAGLPGSIVEVDVRSGAAFGCARTSAGEVWCWGQGSSGVTG